MTHVPPCCDISRCLAPPYVRRHGCCLLRGDNGRVISEGGWEGIPPQPRVNDGRRKLWLKDDLDQAILPADLAPVRDAAEDL